MRCKLKIKFCKKCLKEIPSLEEKLSINPKNDFKRMIFLRKKLHVQRKLKKTHNKTSLC